MFPLPFPYTVDTGVAAPSITKGFFIMVSDKEKCAHDLALLYMQAEIKNGMIDTPYEDPMYDFVSLYYSHYDKILNILETDY